MNYKKDKSYIAQRLEYKDAVDYISELEQQIEDLQNENRFLRSHQKLNETFFRFDLEDLINENERLRTVLNGSEEKRKKAIEWVKKHIETYQKNEIVILDWDNFSDPRNLLKILVGGDE